ncbi:MAG: SLBB domain-containing protein [Chitinophagales bacterium]|nr:SLBB domain-containing protein [Chitinophagales bacterium]
MNLKHIYIILFVLLGCSNFLLAQTGENVETNRGRTTDTTNLELNQLKEKYGDVDGGAIESLKLQQPSSIDGLINSSEISKVQEGLGTRETQEENREQIDQANVASESAEKIIEAVATENKENLEAVPIYGFKYFRESKTKLFSSALDVRPPYNYVLGVGDQLNIAIWGFADYNEIFTIEKDGYIQPQYVGRIYLKGLTLENAIQVIKARYSRAYMVENSQFDVTLNYSRVISVNVVGEVELPGSYTVPAVNTVFNLLAFIGGPTKIGSIRNIQIKRNGVVIRKFDLYEFLNNPTAQDDYFLQNNDYIFVPMSDKLVKISGAVQRPFTYELLPDESFDDLLKYAGGYAADALTNYIQITRYVNNKQVLLDFNLDSLRLTKTKLKLYNGDEIMVRTIPEKAKNWVDLKGPFKVPDRYELRPGDRVSDLFDRALGYADNAYKKEAYIFRQNYDDDGLRSVIRIDLGKAISDYNSDQNILLQDRDEFYLINKEIFIDRYTIQIKGAVRKPDEYPAQKGMTLRDAFLYTGGVLPSAYLERGFIKRIDRTTNKPYYLSFKIDTTDNYKALDKIEIVQGDEIRVLSNLSFMEDKTVSISGAVNNPLVMEYWENMNLKDLILLAQGFKERVFLDKIIITRTDENFQRKIITLPIDTSNNMSKLEDFKLQETDNVLVFSNEIFDINSKVTVSGSVNSPAVFDYKEGTTLSDILLMAGGFSMDAASNRIEIARISNFNDVVVNSEPTQISIEVLEIDRDFVNDPIASTYILRPFDQIYVRRIPDFDFQKKVEIVGEVKYPGYYVLKKNEKLSDIIRRAGGLTEEAYTPGTKLTRNYNKVGKLLVNLDKAMRRPGSKFNYVLKSQDSIYIPTRENIVTVRGQIDYPFYESDMKRLVLLYDTISPEDYLKITPEKKISVPHTKGKRAKYYIKKYGSGFGKYAKKKDTYVILPNGHIKGTKYAIFTRAYPKVIEGSEVVIPRKPLKKKKGKLGNAQQSMNRFNAIIEGALGSITTTLTLYLLLKRTTD